jgi:hypothetical protein
MIIYIIDNFSGKAQRTRACEPEKKYFSHKMIEVFEKQKSNNHDIIFSSNKTKSSTQVFHSENSRQILIRNPFEKFEITFCL